MRKAVAAVILACGLTGPVSAESVAEEVTGVISDQFQAFAIDDFATAFTFASPGLRQYFETPERFGAMVRQGYPMVWRPGDVRFLSLEGEGRARRQIVEVTDRAGRPFRLEYSMVRTEEGWRIDAVRFLPMPPPMT